MRAAQGLVFRRRLETPGSTSLTWPDLSVGRGNRYDKKNPCNRKELSFPGVFSI